MLEQGQCVGRPVGALLQQAQLQHHLGIFRVVAQEGLQHAQLGQQPGAVGHQPRRGVHLVEAGHPPIDWTIPEQADSTPRQGRLFGE